MKRILLLSLLALALTSCGGNSDEVEKQSTQDKYEGTQEIGTIPLPSTSFTE